jgi:pyocin large subunit-like protein
MGGRGAGTGAPEPRWRFPDLTRAQHFRRHGADFEAGSVQEYERLASVFANRRDADGVESFVSHGGLIFMYEPATNTFMMRKVSTRLITFFKPTSADYWKTQRSLHEATE